MDRQKTNVKNRRRIRVLYFKWKPRQPEKKTKRSAWIDAGIPGGL